MTLHLNLPSELQQEMQRRATESGHASIEQYAESLIRADLQHALTPELEQALAEGLASGPPAELPANFWSDLRRRSPGTAQP
jgi:hypothetical protein